MAQGHNGEPVLGFEPKGRPIVSGPDMLHVVIASNEDWIVPASGTSGPKPPKQPPAARSGRGKGIGKLAERLIVEHPDRTYRRIAGEVHARIEGAKASEKSVRWYASRMRRRGEEIANRRKNSDCSAGGGYTS